MIEETDIYDRRNRYIIAMKFTTTHIQHNHRCNVPHYILNCSLRK